MAKAVAKAKTGTANAASARAEVEDFLYAEAALLDTWDLETWLALFTEDGCYLMPSLDAPDGTPENSLYLISDDRARLGSRVKQLLGRHTWAENPVSRTRRIVGNVRIRHDDGETLRVTANFAVYRLRHEMVDNYVGRYEHELVRTKGGLRFRVRKAILDLEALRPHGKVSFIV
ncbi:MAG: aromatic-ring-hydroxylating dioxygenase subunit beta [Alphaproteobacteria bacterium]